MSHRPASTPVGQNASTNRLTTVLAAGLAHKQQQRSMPTDAPADSPADGRKVRRLENLGPGADFKLLTSLPPELVEKIINDLSCKQITELCELDSTFSERCGEEVFWKSVCDVRKWNREDRLFPTAAAEENYWGSPEISSTDRVPYMGSWRKHYSYWCKRVLDNAGLRFRVGRLLATEQNRAYIDDFLGPIASWDVSKVSDMSRVFAFASNFNADLSKWDVSNVENMRHMFTGTDFNGNLSKWDVSKVTDMRGMFKYAEVFDGDLSGWKDKVKNVKDMSHMFMHAVTFNGDISKWNVSSVKRMDYMFNNASSFNGDISGWNVSSVERMDYMFGSASSFNGDLSKWVVSSVVSMEGMFHTASSFNGDLSGWNVSGVEDMTHMFYKASSFNGDLSRWDVSSVEYISGMFALAKSFNCGVSPAAVALAPSLGAPLPDYLSLWNMSSVQHEWRDPSRMFRFAENYKPPDGYAIGQRFKDGGLAGSEMVDEVAAMRVE